MNNTRTVARDLVRSGLLNILQREVINEQDEFRGPIRLAASTINVQRSKK